MLGWIGNLWSDWFCHNTSSYFSFSRDYICGILTATNQKHPPFYIVSSFHFTYTTYTANRLFVCSMFIKTEWLPLIGFMIKYYTVLANQHSLRLDDLLTECMLQHIASNTNTAVSVLRFLLVSCFFSLVVHCFLLCTHHILLAKWVAINRSFISV